MEKGARSNLATAVFSLLLVILALKIVSAAAPTWDFYGANITFNEDNSPTFSYNFSNNITEPDGDPLTFSLGNNIVSTVHGNQSTDFFYWFILNDSTGVLVINATLDNQTGQYNLSINAEDDEGPPLSAGLRPFFFTINATNDYPVFTNIQPEYNLTQDTLLLDFINATDEEEHYPLEFMINFTSCTPASWSSRTSPNDCQIFNFTTTIYSEDVNISTMLNFTPAYNDVGVYYANISVMDYGENYSCPSTHCETNYQSNRTTYYSASIAFNVFANLTINATDCQNIVFQENQSTTCQVNITSVGQTDTLNISSFASVRNNANANVTNTSWFYTTNITGAVAFVKSVDINVTPQKSEVGNWTINFTVQDLTSGTNATEQIYVYVNRTFNDAVDIINIPNTLTSQDAFTVINFTVYDKDFLIPDKSEGYNETLNVTVTALNRSDLSQTLPFGNLTPLFYFYPVSGSNRTEGYLQFAPNATETGNFTFNVTVRDTANTTDTVFFNLTVLENQAPAWNETLPTPIVTGGTEDVELYFNYSLNVSDTDGDTLSFTYTNTSQFNGFVSGFNLTTGVLNFTPTDVDVGYHAINITVTDGYLTDIQTFNFTIANVNDDPDIQDITAALITNEDGGDSTVGINVSENENITIEFWVDDDDLRIPSSQKTFYNENFTINLTIQGPNTDLFSFSQTGSFPTTSNPQRFSYEAEFAPNASDIGEYNITITIIDNSSATDTLVFNLTVFDTAQAPEMSSVGNQELSVFNETLYIDINTTDAEDINETYEASNLTYTLTNLTAGGDFLTINETTGIINFTFNQTYAGVWTYNLSVNDSSGLYDSEVFNITIYDVPSIDYPPASLQFNFKENVTTTLNFTANDTVSTQLDGTLNYSLFINGIYKNATLDNGNGTEFLWNFTANFTDNVCDEVMNFTLNVSNALLSVTRTWNLTINHTNHPLGFTADIGNQEAASPITVTLSSYFTDFDLPDPCIVDQNVTFNYTLVNGSSDIAVTIVNWTNGTTPTATFSAGSAVSGMYYITATETNLSGDIIAIATSNNFTINITTSDATSPSTGGGGGGGGGSTRTETETVSLKIIVPEPVIAKQRDSFSVPIGFFNDGEVGLSDILVNTTVTKNAEVRNDLVATLDLSAIDSLPIEAYENGTLSVSIDTQDTGIFEVLVSTYIADEDYLEYQVFYVQVEDEENIREKILFTEEFIVGNPECTELTELVVQARALLDAGDLPGASKKADEALEACKRAIAQEPSTRIIERVGDRLFGTLGIASLTAFVLGFGYYYFRRIRLKRQLRGYPVSNSTAPALFYDSVNGSSGLLEKARVGVFFLVSFGVLTLIIATTGSLSITGNVISDNTATNLNWVGAAAIVMAIALVVGVRIRNRIKRERVYRNQPFYLL